ncbi:MAG: UvrB/UvrC motif-containing protein [Phycisphaerae bacterium]|nr:UvrB/UvrC motif-containing protein [Phycisphaerae bacterium]NNF43845.1 UvrB/UvrC motif-containing protein [Phycisphaerales bacterium]
MASEDLSGFLAAWPHEPGRVNARLITGDDEREWVQVRLDLGVLQMSADGRPDGVYPENHESLLDYHVHRREQYVRQTSTSAGFVLSPDECRSLREEAVQYYHRYVALFAIGDYDRVIRDTSRNLRLFDLCRDCGAAEPDRTLLEQFRPHVITMRARAQAELAVAEQQPKQALAAIDAGLAELRAHLEEGGQTEAFERSSEAQLLRGMRDALIPKLPASQRVELEERLRAALDAENYELAAILRDELRLLRD